LSGGSWAALTLNYVAPLGEERECSEPDGISPISYSLLSASSQLLTWNRSDCDYWVYAGPTAGSSEYSDSGNLGNQNSYWLSGYPEGNAYFTVTLFYRPLSGGSWDSKVLTYTAPPEEAECTEPLRLSGNSLLAVGSELLEWEFTNCEYWIYAGATPGANEFADSGNLGSTTAYLLEGYPTNISYIYVTLFYRPPSERAWKRRVIQYCGPSNTQDCD
jgi:hypothetical protein